MSYNDGAWSTFSAGVALVNGAAVSTWYTPVSTGNYDFRAIYSGDSKYLASQSGNGDEPLVVESGLGEVSVTTLLSQTIITLGDSITDDVTVASMGEPTPVPTGTVEFQVQIGAGEWNAFDTQTLSASGDDGVATSIAYEPLTVGSYHFRAIYSGDSEYLGSQSGDMDEPLTVQPQQSTDMIWTLLSQNSIILGESVTDNVTVPGMDGFPVPTGTVEFQVQIGAGVWTTFDTQTLSASGDDGVATSIAYMPMMVDAYHFRAVYLGDSEYFGSQSGDMDEPLIVNEASSTTMTVLGEDSIDLGQSVTDNATVTGLGDGFPMPTGTVDFQVSYDGGEWMTYDTGVILVNGAAISIMYMPMAAGDYDFRAIYSGDSNYLGSQSGDEDEPLYVTDSECGPCWGIILGQSVTDNATVTGLGDGYPMPTGTVDFQVNFEGGAWMTYDADVILVDGSAISTWYTPMVTGNYFFRAIYSGDDNYLPSQSGECEEPLCVAPASSTTVTLLSSDNINLGESITDFVTVSGLGNGFPVPTGSVDFQVQIGAGEWNNFDTQTLSALGDDGVATSIAYMPLSSGSYHFRAIYSGDSNYLASQSGDEEEPLTVQPALILIPVTTLLSQTTITLGDSITDDATVPGLGEPFAVPTGTVEFQVQIGAGVWTTFDTQTLSASGDDGVATSIAYMPMMVDDYHFRAVYLGDSNYLGSQSADGDEPLIVNEASSTTTTVLGTSSIILGQSVYDNATVMGLDGSFPMPTGMVDFQVSFNGGAWETYHADVVLVDGKATSNWYMPMMTGDYDFRAIYSGDSNYLGSQSADGDEPLLVSEASSTTTTMLGALNIILGQSVTDNATVTGLGDGFPMPTGTVDFQVRINDGAWTTYDAGVVLVNGEAMSIWYMPMLAVEHDFRAIYSGDDSYLPSQSGECEEPLCVAPASSTTTTLLSSDHIYVGGSVTDDATVTGLGNGFPVPTGSVDFQVQIGAGEWNTFDTEQLSNGVATSMAYMPLTAGSYHFRAIYSGDDNYFGSQSGNMDEPLQVDLAPSVTTTELGVTIITLGQSVTDNATVTGLGDGFPMPTGTVDFQVSFNGGAWATYDAGVVLVNGEATSTWYKPMAAGNYTFRAIYSGDSNYLGSQSGDGDEPLEVLRAPSDTTTDLGGMPRRR